MKKVITLCLFALITMLGTESVMAQNSELENRYEINTTATKKVEALKKYVQLSNEQCDQMYKSLKLYGEAKASIDNAPENAEEIAKIEKRLDDNVKIILSDEQYVRYKSFNEEN